LIEDFLVKLIKISILVAPINNPATIKEDPADNAILAAAIDGHADFIVSGDQHLLVLREYQGIKILAPADFIEEIKK
jgi:putative PIN family toxin of toxin-antitoxin system